MASAENLLGKVMKIPSVLCLLGASPRWGPSRFPRTPLLRLPALCPPQALPRGVCSGGSPTALAREDACPRPTQMTAAGPALR